MKQNAEKNNVTFGSVKYFVKSRGIDREIDRQTHIVSKIKEEQRRNPGASKAELARLTGFSTGTITKYLPLVEGKVDIVSKRPRVCVSEDIHDLQKKKQ